MSQTEKPNNKTNLNFSSLLPAKQRTKAEREAPFEQIASPKGSTKDRRRVGRGRATGVGKTSGKGQKGQKSRSGYSHTPGFEGGQMPLHRRVPKRGFSNYTRVTYQEVNLYRLDKAGVSGEVNAEVLFKNGLIRDQQARIKVLGTGEIKGKIDIEADAFSASAKQKIEAAGGSCKLRDRKAARQAEQAAKKAAREEKKKAEG